MKKWRIVGFVLSVISIIMILLGIIISIDIPEKINRERCFNLPIDEFFEEKSCKSYWDGE